MAGTVATLRHHAAETPSKPTTHAHRIRRPNLGKPGPVACDNNTAGTRLLTGCHMGPPSRRAQHTSLAEHLRSAMLALSLACARASCARAAPCCCPYQSRALQLLLHARTQHDAACAFTRAAEHAAAPAAASAAHSRLAPAAALVGLCGALVGLHGGLLASRCCHGAKPWPITSSSTAAAAS